MRFKRADLPGFLIAVIAPSLLTVLFFRAFDVFDHRGTPLLGIMSVNLAVCGGLLSMFTRFVRNWYWPLACVLVLGVAVIGVIWMQSQGTGDSGPATALKWTGLLAFFAANLTVGVQVLIHGLLPLVDRRAERRARS